MEKLLIKKKSLITLLLSIVLLSVLIIAFSLSRRTKTSSQTISESSSSVTVDSNYPSLNHLKALLSANDINTKLQIFGKTQITMVLFQDKNIAVLSPESGKKIQLPIKVTNQKKNLFAIPTIKFASNALKVGDSFGLARKEKQYFAYQLDN